MIGRSTATRSDAGAGAAILDGRATTAITGSDRGVGAGIGTATTGTADVSSEASS